jgi:asparagine synthase (glutamine-hydrolysing)
MMCGIVGIIGNHHTFPVDRFLEMRDSIAHRGPDDAGTWESPTGTALLGSRRLATLDLSESGHQPMEDKSTGLVIVFNGEIYNYLELAAELAGKGCCFQSRSDTEVLLKSYHTWGTECLNRLNGMFSFAIWDERQQVLFVARDRFGEKPFFYYLDDDRQFLAFGSEIKALVAGRFFQPRPDLSSVYGYLVNREMDSRSETMFAGVSSLPAANALLFSWRDRSVKTWRYWDLNPEREVRLPDARQYSEQFLEILSDSVRIRRRADVPVGSSLSGGLDSSTIVGLIARNGGNGRQETFSARFSDPQFDEGKHIELVTRWANVKSHHVYPDPNRLPEEVEALTWYQDEPFYSTTIYAQWCVMRLAKECGVTVLLDGQGGDEVLAGYHHYFAAYYLNLLRRLQFSKTVFSLKSYVASHGRSLLPIVVAGLLPVTLRSAVTQWLRPRALPEDFKAKWRRRPAQTNQKFRDPVHQSLYATLTQTSLPELLRYADRNSMAFSREVRLPFLDHRLVEFLFAIPVDQKISGHTTKVILRNAISGIVPEAIRNRKDKVGFAPPEVSWLRGPLCLWVEEVISSAEFRHREWCDAAAVDSAWKRFKKGEGGLHTSIWRWLSLEVWARTCLAPKPIKQANPALLASAIAKSANAL